MLLPAPTTASPATSHPTTTPAPPSEDHQAQDQSEGADRAVRSDDRRRPVPCDESPAGERSDDREQGEGCETQPAFERGEPESRLQQKAEHEDAAGEERQECDGDARACTEGTAAEQREIDQRDRRRQILTITDSGRKLLGQAEELLGDEAKGVLGALTAQQRADLYELAITVLAKQAPETWSA